MGIQWKRVSCVHIPSILYKCKRQGALEEWIDSATFLAYRALAMVFPGPPHCTPVPKKSRSLQLYILVECKRQGAFLKISAILSLGSIIVSKVLKCNSLSLSLNLQRVEQCLDVGIKSLQATSLGLSKKCITIKCIFLLLCDFIGF
jgi:hypothetical protein